MEETSPIAPQSRKPFCSQPWTTLYVQWDGKVTRPCIRGPQNLGALDEVEDIDSLWNGAAMQTVRRSVVSEANLNTACRGCHGARSRTIDHIGPFGRNIGGDFGFDKVENFYDAVDAHEAGVDLSPARPIVLVLDMSAKCHIRCPKCFVYNSDMQYGLGHMTPAVFEKVRPLFRTALEVIGHENGECMLNKRFFEMVEEIKAAGCRFMFNTTGQLIDEAKAERLVEVGVDKIMFSIDGVEPETYERLHKGGTLDKLMRGLDALAEAKARTGRRNPSLGWYFVACRSNLEQMETAARMAVERGFAMMYVSELNRPTGEQWRSYFDFYKVEGIARDPALVARYREALASTRTIARQGGLEFFTGSADA